MNEWETIAWTAVVGAIIFGAVWVLIDNSKKSLEGRIKNCEHVIDNMAADCARKKEDFITTRAFDRFEGHLNVRMDGFNKNFDHLTKRIDDLIHSLRNEKTNE